MGARFGGGEGRGAILWEQCSRDPIFLLLCPGKLTQGLVTKNKKDQGFMP